MRDTLTTLSLLPLFLPPPPGAPEHSKFIQDKYHVDEKPSSYMAGAVYDVSMLLSPFLGLLIVSHPCHWQNHQCDIMTQVIIVWIHVYCGVNCPQCVLPWTAS